MIMDSVSAASAAGRQPGKKLSQSYLARFRLQSQSNEGVRRIAQGSSVFRVALSTL
jgi:hypothetical protein